MSIGFGKFNHIHSLETSISERHALIGRSQTTGKFFVQDLGSKYGTYIKINQRTPLNNGMIIEIGSYQFMVADINLNSQTLKLKQTNQVELESS
jgi:pSer/pThr/pTyr-binding forkhead associated (FHA) protein